MGEVDFGEGLVPVISCPVLALNSDGTIFKLDDGISYLGVATTRLYINSTTISLRLGLQENFESWYASNGYVGGFDYEYLDD